MSIKLPRCREMIQKFRCVLQTQAIKSQPTALQIPFIPLSLTLMWFSLDHLAWDGGWVTWHYKCLFIKLSLQVILLGSFVFLLNLSMFSHHTLSETPQTSLFLCVVSAEETLNDFVSFCWINSKHFHLDTFTVKPHVDLRPPAASYPSSLSHVTHTLPFLSA